MEAPFKKKDKNVLRWYHGMKMPIRAFKLMANWLYHRVGPKEQSQGGRGAIPKRRARNNSKRSHLEIRVMIGYTQ